MRKPKQKDIWQYFGGGKFVKNQKQEKRDKARNFIEAGLRKINQDRLSKDHFLPDKDSFFAKLERIQVWEAIFDYITDPHDIKHISETCAQFCEHLKMKALLPEVLDVLFEKKCLITKYPYTYSAILNLRLVSRSWKQAVDVQFSDYPFMKPDWAIKFYPRRTYRNELLCETFTYSRCIEQDLFDAPVISPSLLRFLQLELFLSPNRVRIRFYSKLYRFLDTHGDSVWSLELEEEQLSADKAYKVLFNILTRIPNLKQLSVRLSECNFRRYKFRKDDAKRLDYNRAKYPLPPTASLEKLVFQSHNNHNKLILAEILRSSKNLKAVHTVYYYPADNEIYDEKVSRAMENLRLQNFGAQFVFCAVSFLYLRNFLHYSWPLREMYLGCDRICGEEPAGHNMLDYLDVIDHFRGTLQQFTCNGLNVDVDFVRNFCNDFSHLNEVSIEGHHCYKCISYCQDPDSDDGDDYVEEFENVLRKSSHKKSSIRQLFM